MAHAVGTKRLYTKFIGRVVERTANFTQSKGLVCQSKQKNPKTSHGFTLDPTDDLTCSAGSEQISNRFGGLQSVQYCTLTVYVYADN
uniref:Uncharacterized protein n=1 Tax=Anguilla anguilla TaxID=7936 RepID=A0A0E9WT07_ANGAN